MKYLQILFGIAMFGFGCTTTGEETIFQGSPSPVSTDTGDPTTAADSNPDTATGTTAAETDTGGSPATDDDTTGPDTASESGTTDTSTDSGADGDTDTDTDTDTDADTDTSPDGGVDAGGPDGGGEFSDEICDGVDNDGNGIIDDVDVGKDGICDCLNIATVGLAGVWGDGNVFADWLTDRSSMEVIHLEDALLDDATLQPFQVIVFLDVSSDSLGRTYSSDEVDAILRWVENGGGIMTTTGYFGVEEVDNANTILEPLGLAYDTADMLPQSQAGGSNPITEWAVHPISEGITAVGVHNGKAVLGDREIIATASDLIVAQAYTHGEGNVFVWGDEWITYDSEWVDRADYQVERFWINVIKWLTPETECQVPIIII